MFTFSTFIVILQTIEGREMLISYDAAGSRAWLLFTSPLAIQANTKLDCKDILIDHVQKLGCFQFQGYLLEVNLFITHQSEHPILSCL